MKSESTMRRSNPLVIGTGLVALDVIIGPEKQSAVRHWAGGTCGNVLLALRYLGWIAKPVARLGAGAATDLVLSDFRQWKVSDDFVRVETDGSTPVIVERIRKSASGIPKHSFSWRCPACNARFPGYKPELSSVAEGIIPRLKNPQVFFFDRVSAGALVLARACAQAGALVVFEPSGVGNPMQFREAWETAHIVKYSHERLNDLPDIDVPGSPNLVIETLGDSGLRYRNSRAGKGLGRWVELEAFPVSELKDAAGAGDWCTAGVLSRIGADGLAGYSKSSDHELYEAFKYGQALAAWNCGFEGARGGMYAVSKKTFQKQVQEILLGTQHVVPAKLGASKRQIDVFDSLCRTCDPSATRRELRQSRAM